MLQSLDVRERRAAHRIQVNLPANYASEVAHLSGWVSNLSRTGLFLRSPFLDDRGTDVEISFELPGSATAVQVRGRVVRVHDGPLCPGMAVRFTEIPVRAARRLDDFIRRHGRKLANS